MENKSSGWCDLTGVICYIMGVSFATTLLLLPIAIYCFIGGSRYFAWAKLTDGQIATHKKSLINWAIFVSIVAFPIGLVSIIPCIKVGNNPVVTDVKSEWTFKVDGNEDNNEPVSNEVPQETQAPVVNSNKEETIEKLKRFRDEGLITESEYKRAIAEINKEK